MKLNFAELFNQIDNEQDYQSTTVLDDNNKRKLESSSQLNYYRKSIVDQKDLATFGKPKKSQLNDDTSQFMLGSSILESYFSAKSSSVIQQQQQQPKVNLSVMYPYQVSTSVNPSKIDEQIKSMKANGILNQSAMKFIKKQITKSLSKSKQKNLQRRKENRKQNKIFNQSVNEVHQSIFLDSSIEIQGQTLTDFLNITDKEFQNTQDPSIFCTTVSSKLFRHFLRDSTQNSIDSSPRMIDKKTFSTKQILTPIAKKNAFMGNVMQSVTPHYMKPFNRKQKFSETRKNIVPTHVRKLQQALKQVRSKPSLQLTKSSPFTQKIIEKRQNQHKGKKTSVFDSLYKEAYKRQCMNELKKESVQKQIDQKINQKKTLQTKRAQKYKVDGSFMQRLEKSIQRKYYKEYLIKKYQTNPKTGQPFFFPDTNTSKRTYEQLFHKSLEKLTTQYNEQEPDFITLKEDNKKQSEKAMSTHLSHTLRSGKKTQQSSKDKPLYLDRLNKSTEMLTDESYQLTQSRSKIIMNKKDSKVIQRILRLFYPFLNDGNTSHNQKTGIVNEQLGFQKTYEALYQLSQKEYIILSPLFDQVQELQKSSKVTSLIFANLLTQFYKVLCFSYKKKLNHYDKVILQKKVQNKLHRDSKQPEETKIRSSRVFQKSVESKSTRQKKQPDYERKPTYRPLINQISASMEKINPKYQAELYYV